MINIGAMIPEMSNHDHLFTTHCVIESREKNNNDNDNENDGDCDSNVDNNNIDNNTANQNNSTTVTTCDSFEINVRMSSPCYPLPQNYDSTDHYLREHLVTLGVILFQVLDDLLSKYPNWLIAG